MVAIVGAAYVPFLPCSPPPSSFARIRSRANPSRGVQTEIDLDTLGDEDIAEVIPELLADYSAECKDWTLFAGEHWKCKRWDRAEELLVKAIQRELFDARVIEGAEADGG
jgi:hypothetical protein